MVAESLDDFLNAVSNVRSGPKSDAAQQIWHLTQDFFAGNGFDKLIYLDKTPVRLTLLTTLPEEWTAHYHAHNYAAIDPFMTYCCTTYRPVSTGIAYCHNYGYLTAPAKQLIREAADVGMIAGFSTTTRKQGAAGVAGWNIGSSLPGAEVDALRADREHALRLAAQHAHSMLSQALCAAQSLVQGQHLSRRETECMGLLTQGLRTKDIARQLGISPVAVDLYLSNARRKLGARTREQAVATALALRLLPETG